MSNLQKINYKKNEMTTSSDAMSIFEGDIIQDPVEQYKLRLGSPNSMRTVETRIKQCALIWNCKDRYGIVWNKLTKAHVSGLLKTLESQKKSLSTIKNTLSCLKGVVEEAYDLDMITTENHSRIMSLKPPKGSQVDTGLSLEVEQISSLFKHLSSLEDPIGARDNVVLKMLITTGLRRSEITNIKMEDIDFKRRIALIKGKGNKERTVGLNETVNEALNFWVEEFRGNDSGFLFSRIRKCGTIITDKKFSDQSIYDIAKRRCKEVGIKKIAAHDLRRTFATMMIENGVDLIDVMKMMGHSSPETTKRYDKSGLNKAMNIMKKMEF